MVNIQVQTVLFKSDLNLLFRSLDSVCNAAKRFNDGICLSFCIGDASPEQSIENQYLPKTLGNGINICYSYFNENTGFGRGHNRLGLGATSDYILIINPDIFLSGDFFIETLPLICSSDVGIVEARQVPLEHPKEYDILTGETSWASGACFFIRTDIFNQLKGFDENFFMCCEDVDLSWRVRNLGYRILYQPRALAFHDKRLSVSAKSNPTEFEIYHTCLSSLLMAYKWKNKQLYEKLLREYEGALNLKGLLDEFLERKSKLQIQDKNYYSGKNFHINRYVF